MSLYVILSEAAAGGEVKESVLLHKKEYGSFDYGLRPPLRMTVDRIATGLPTLAMI